jgi:indolepyruvate ferredoxin oxidoreductase beta subunit
MTAAPARWPEGGGGRISIAILAMGGQGGGVLADWIVTLAESQGWAAQSTSVPGVAQRTGATIYYIETAPPRGDALPILALMPTPGDVDCVMAAELMEAGRSVLRGLVTPDRTTLIASTHRSPAVVEKQAPGDGVADPQAVVEATDFAAKRLVAFDMERLAKSHGSVISATMLGALAAAEVLPFPREAFEATIRAGGTGVEASLRAFAAALAQAKAKPVETVQRFPQKRFVAWPTATGNAEFDELGLRIGLLPAQAQPMIAAGARKLVDHLDAAYAGEYLDRLAEFADADRAADGAARGFAFTVAAAKYLAAAMAYDDLPRVADLKLRAGRQARVRREVGASDGSIVTTTEYFHPRVEEMCATLPAKLGAWIEARPRLVAQLRKVVDRGRRISPNTVSGYLMLALVAQRGPKRRGSLRHAREMAHIEAWLGAALAAFGVDYDLGVAVLGCRRLVKGYSDTHARGLSKFDRVMSAVPLLKARDDGAAWLARLTRAALADENGATLDGVLKTVATL